MGKADVIPEPQPGIAPLADPDGEPSLIGDYWHFISAFVRRPTTIGAVAPSSRALAESMCPGELEQAHVAVELGAGTGAVTRIIRRHLDRDASLIVLEMHAGAAARLQRHFHDLHVIEDTAENLRQHLDRLGHRHADCIVSGLPWSSMSGDLQDRLLDSVVRSLRPGGVFTAMAYLHAGGFPTSRRFKRELHRRFEHVTRTPVVWANVPPAFVYHCQSAR
jgi:phospholipid N-methyltransferase